MLDFDRIVARLSDAKLVDHIVERVHAKIALGELAPGDRLRQELLAEEFNVSRTPVREALRLLEAKGIISQEHRHSAVVRGPTPREVRETYLVRAELEGLAAELAARWISDKQLSELRQIHGRFVRSVRELSSQRNGSRGNRLKLLKASNSWIDTNNEFHEVIQVASNNLRLRRVIDELYLGFIRNVLYSSARGMDSHRMKQNIDDHAEILAALERRSPAAARKAMRNHVLDSGEFVSAWLENQMSGRPE